MNRQELLYSIPYVLSLFLTSGIFLYAWRHRRIRAGAAFAWYVGGQALYIAGFILEMISPDLQAKIFWDKFQWLAETIIIIVAFMSFAVDFTEHKFKRPRLAWVVILVFPAVFLLLLASDPLHHLIYINPRLDPPRPFTELTYDFGFVVYAYSIYIYLVTLYGLGLLLRRILKSHALYRGQLIGIGLGFLIPVVASLLTLSNVELWGQRDIGPITFGIGNLIVAFSLYRFRIFEVVPIARDVVVENLSDPVIVLDNGNRVVDLNPAALAGLGVTGAQAIGESAQVVFAAWPDLVARFRDVRQLTTRFTTQVSDRQRF